MILRGHVLDRLPEIAAGSVQTAVTSPPYWGQRRYGIDGEAVAAWPAMTYRQLAGGSMTRVGEWRGELGHEPEVELYVAHLVAVARELWRVLKPDGALWLNLGDTYISRGGGSSAGGERGHQGPRILDGSIVRDTPNRLRQPIPPKSLAGIPWRVALALQADGWTLRSSNVWHKSNPTPESVRDRPTRAHEYVFLLTKSNRYYWSVEASTEPAEGLLKRRGERPMKHQANKRPLGKSHPDDDIKRAEEHGHVRHIRDVWAYGSNSAGNHPAAMPQALASRCVLLTSRPGDLVLDPFAGSGTTGEAARAAMRDFVGIEIVPAFADAAEIRLAQRLPLEVAVPPELNEQAAPR